MVNEVLMVLNNHFNYEDKTIFVKQWKRNLKSGC